MEILIYPNIFEENVISINQNVPMLKRKKHWCLQN